MFLHLGSVRSYVSDCVMCEAAYAGFILLLLPIWIGYCLLEKTGPGAIPRISHPRALAQWSMHGVHVHVSRTEDMLALLHASRPSSEDITRRSSYNKLSLPLSLLCM